MRNTAQNTNICEYCCTPFVMTEKNIVYCSDGCRKLHDQEIDEWNYLKESGIYTNEEPMYTSQYN